MGENEGAVGEGGPGGEGDETPRGSQCERKQKVDNGQAQPKESERVSKRKKGEKNVENVEERSELRVGGMSMSAGVSRKRKGSENGSKR
jgi:hypothetical protein